MRCCDLDDFCRIIVKALPVGIAALRRDGEGIDLTLYAGERITYRRARRRLLEAVLAYDSPLIGKKLSDPLFRSIMHDATPAGIRAAKNDPRLWGSLDNDSVGAEEGLIAASAMTTPRSSISSGAHAGLVAAGDINLNLERAGSSTDKTAAVGCQSFYAFLKPRVVVGLERICDDASVLAT
jgi:hypothetical protein